MSVLLYVPGLLVVLVKKHGIIGAARHVGAIVFFQLLVGAPFLLENARTYVAGAFDLSRVFLYKWTVNWRFVSEQMFLSSSFSRALLASHLVLLLAFAAFKWTKRDGGASAVIRRAWSRPDLPPVLASVTADRTSFCVCFSSYLTYHPRGHYNHVHLKPHWHTVCPLATLPVLRWIRSATALPCMEDPAADSTKVRRHMATGCILADVCLLQTRSTWSHRVRLERVSVDLPFVWSSAGSACRTARGCMVWLPRWCPYSASIENCEKTMSIYLCFVSWVSFDFSIAIRGSSDMDLLLHELLHYIFRCLFFTKQ
jgi:hypothetical protein